MLSFDSGTSFFHHIFVYDFSREIFLMLYSISWANFNVRLSLHIGILGNMSIVIIRCLWRHKYFEIDLSFLIKPFSYITKNSGQKCKYLKN